MKKVWIGEGIAILLITIASIIANKLLPGDRGLPLGVFSACLCLFILSVTVAVIILSSLFQEIKGTSRKRKKDISGIVVMVIIILIWLAGMIIGWIPVVGAIIGWVLRIAGILVEIYVVAGIVIQLLVFFKVIK